MIKTSQPALHGDQHLRDGSDPIPGLIPDAGGDSILDIILSKSAVGLWKLDETSGTTAHDSSGAGNDMTVPNGAHFYTAPTWGQAAGPPGTTSALFATGTGVDAGSRLRVAMPTGMTDDFSAGAWVRVNDTGLGGELMGQGLAIHSTGGGWTLVYNVATGKFALVIGGAGYPVRQADNVSAINTWYLFGVSRIAGTWTLYLDGLLQAATSTLTPTAAETATWLGDCGFSSANHGCNQTISWAFITDTPLDGSDWLALYESGISGGTLASGEVWTSDGAGGASWQPNLATIAKDGDTPLTGDVTLSEGTNVTLTQVGQDIEIAAASGSPTGAAGGALDGTYPNPGLAAAVAGAGLAETTNVLSVNVDGSTVEITSDTLRVKADGITATQIAAGEVGSSELASTAVTPASYGDATHVAAFTVDQDGRLTAASNVTITGSGGTSPTDTAGWMPLTTVLGGVPDLVWDATDALIPTYGPF